MALAQQAIQNGQSNGQERRISGGSQDWANMAASMGMNNGGQGLSREAMIKQVGSPSSHSHYTDYQQLQALQNTAGNRARLNQLPPPSPLNGLPISSPSPANYTAPSPAAPSPIGIGAPSPVPATPHNPSTPSNNHIALNATSQQINAPPRPVLASQPRPPSAFIGLNGPTTNGSGNAPDQQLTEAQRGALFAQAEQIRAANARAAQARPPPTPNTAPINSRPPRPPGPGSGPGQNQGRAPADPAASRLAFQTTMSGYYKATGITPPPEIWSNGVKDGALNISGVWIYLMELFMMVMRHGGVQNVGSLF